ncbi:MAG: GNAT family N-acetyltransferase [Candidatus Thermoplasmatota archaeon]
MHVREATTDDTKRWNAFVEAEGGSFFHYFEWKTLYEERHWQYIPLILEGDSKEIIGIFPLVKIKGFLHAQLVSLPEGASGGFILNKNLTDREKQHALRLFFDSINEQYSKGCSSLYLKENLSLQDACCTQPTLLLTQNGFTFRGYTRSQLPCTYRLELSTSFENDIWKDLWGKYLRNHIRKSQKQGVVIRQDTKLHYTEEIITMLSLVYKRFQRIPPSREELLLRLTTFKGKTKVWIAFLDDAPIATLVCYYDCSSICYASKLGYKPHAREHYTTVSLFSEAIGDACESRYHYFDFGTTDTPTLARWKEQFKPVKIPMRIYEKRYSGIRTVFEKTPAMLRWSLENPRYVWDHRKRLLQKLIK